MFVERRLNCSILPFARDLVTFPCLRWEYLKLFIICLWHWSNWIQSKISNWRFPNVGQKWDLQYPVECDDVDVSPISHSFVIIADCLVTLSGRDLLCALGLTIVCSDTGLTLRKSDPCKDLPSEMVCHTTASYSFVCFWSVNMSSLPAKIG